MILGDSGGLQLGILLEKNFKELEYYHFMLFFPFFFPLLHYSLRLKACNNKPIKYDVFL